MGGRGDLGTRHGSRWGEELAQRWPFGLGALFLGVVIPIGAGVPDPTYPFGQYRSEVTVAIITISGFASLLLILAAAMGRRRRDFAMAGFAGLLVVVHPALGLFFEAQPTVVDTARLLVGAAVIGAIAATTAAPGRVGRAIRNLAGGLSAMAGAGFLLFALGSSPWVEPSALLALSAAAVAAGGPALLVGQRHTDGGVISVGLLTLSVGFGGALALMSGGRDLSVGLATVSVVGAVLTVSAAFIAVFEALDRRDAGREAGELARSLEVARLSARSERFEEVAHDQRNSLLAIEAAARRLMLRPSDDLAGAVAQEAARLARLLDGVEDDSASFSASDALEPMLDCLRPLCGRIEVDAEPGVHVWGRPDDLLEIVRTLVDNAREHGRLPVRVTIRRHGPHAVVAVSDQGTGVLPALHDTIFERGVTTSPRRHSGLGLYVARRRAKEMGGDLRVSQADPAEFELMLPSSRLGHGDPEPRVCQLSMFDDAQGVVGG